MNGARRSAVVFFLVWEVLLLTLIVVLMAGTGGLAGSAEYSGADAGRILQLGFNSLFSSAMTGLLAVAWTALPALVAARLERGWRRGLLVALVLLPLLVAPSVLAVCAVRLFSAQGFFPELYYRLFPPVGDTLRFAPVYTLPGLSATLVWAFSPVAFFATWASLARADSSSEDAARLETSPARMLLTIALRAVLPAMLTGGVLVFLLSITEFSVPESLRVQPVLVSDVYTQFGVYYDGRAAAFSALLLVVISVVSVLAAMRIFRYRPGNHELLEPFESQPPAIPVTPDVMSIRAAGWFLGVLPAVALLGTLIATMRGPEGLLLVLSDTWQRSREEFFFSLRLAGGGAALCVVVGVVAGYFMTAVRRPLIPRVVLFASFLLPAPIIGVALKMLMLLPPGSLPFHVDDWLASFDDTLLPLLLAYVIRFSPLVALLTEYQLRAVPAELRQAARLESSSVLGTFRTWGAAAVWPAAVAGGIASLALIMGETGATILLIPPGPTTLSVRLMTLMHYAPTSQVSALSFLITLPTLLVFPLLSGLVWLLTLLRGPGRLVRER